jgi:hypothetical protein
MSDGCDSLDIVEKAAVGAELNRCRVLAAKIANELRNKRPEQFSDSGWFSAACILALSTGPANATAITETINFNAGGYSQSTSTANFSACSLFPQIVRVFVHRCPSFSVGRRDGSDFTIVWTDLYTHCIASSGARE